MFATDSYGQISYPVHTRYSSPGIRQPKDANLTLREITYCLFGWLVGWLLCFGGFFLFCFFFFFFWFFWLVSPLVCLLVRFLDCLLFIWMLICLFVRSFVWMVVFVLVSTEARSHLLTFWYTAIYRILTVERKKEKIWQKNYKEKYTIIYVLVEPSSTRQYYSRYFFLFNAILEDQQATRTNRLLTE